MDEVEVRAAFAFVFGGRAVIVRLGIEGGKGLEIPVIEGDREIYVESEPGLAVEHGAEGAGDAVRSMPRKTAHFSAGLMARSRASWSGCRGSRSTERDRNKKGRFLRSGLFFF